MGYLDKLFRGLAVLCGTHPARFDGEACLRKFQFKQWLRSNTWPADCFEQSGKLFAAAKVTEAMQVDLVEIFKSGEVKTTPAGALIKALRVHRSLINATFYKRDMTSIASRDDYERIVENEKVDRHIISDLNALTFWRMRLAATKRFEPSAALGWRAYQAFEDSKAGRYKRTVLRLHFAEREARIPFLFVAEHMFPNILNIEGKLSDEINRQNGEESTEVWRQYIEGVLNVMKELKEEEHERLSQITGLTAKAWTSFESLTPQELKDAEIVGDGRRSASETKKAKRQSPKFPT